jgi:hypothetical protein
MAPDVMNTRRFENSADTYAFPRCGFRREV